MEMDYEKLADLNGEYDIGNRRYRVTVHLLCDFCKKETKLLSIGDGLDLCVDCNKALGKKEKRHIMAENLGVDVSELEE